MPKAQKTRPKPAERNEMDRAIDRIYQIYGPNLNAFFVAVQKQINKERKESTERVERNG